jgi:hypothetical protein
MIATESVQFLRQITAFFGGAVPFLPRIASGSGDSAHFGRQKALIPAFWK